MPKGNQLSQEKVLKTLESLGLAPLDAQIYVFLGKKGPRIARDITASLRMPKQKIYSSIKNLQNKGIVTATLERPTKFGVVPFEKVLDLFVKAKTEEVHRIEEGKKEFLSDWQSITLAETGDQSPRFTIIEGKNYIFPRLRQMIEESTNQLSVIFTVPDLMRAEQNGLLDAAFSHVSKTNMKFKFLTELSEENLKAVKLLLERMPKSGFDFEVRTPELGLKLISRMLIKDDAEVAFFISQETNRAERQAADVCLWTNSSAIVNSFKAVFENLWGNSTAIEKKIAEIETGEPTAKTCVINDPAVAKKKYYDVLNSAKTEIVMMTSAAGLVEAWKNLAHLKERAKKGAYVAIMAPIITSNLEAAIQLSECCNVKHIPTSYLRTTIVDRKHLFQFKNPPLDREKSDEPLSFENTFYTNDSEYVERITSMLDDVWKTAIAPSAITLERITKPPKLTTAPVPENEYTLSRRDSPHRKNIISIEEKPGAITEEYVLNKIINAKRTHVKDPSKDVAVLFGSNAAAVIHPPISFNLPDVFLVFFHLNKQSSFGIEDWLQVHLWLETPNGHAFVPVAIAGDNPKGMERRRLAFAGTPAGQNCFVLKKDELHVQVQGNTLFAGWAVPIQLDPPQYILPPASVLFEGYGKLKCSLLTNTMPSGAKVVTESNGFDAFVTFFHPASKYAGPGTDGVLGREMIMTVELSDK